MARTRTKPASPPVPGDAGTEVTANFAAIVTLMDYLVCQGTERLVLESTSDYWRIWVRHEAHCCIARSAGGNRRRCFSDLMAYQGPKG